MSRRALIVVVCAWSALAHADSPKQHASRLAAEAKVHYAQGELAVAVALLRQAYEIYPEPSLLYNLARALQDEGDVRGAVATYEQYLASDADVADRAALEHRVATLKAQLAKIDAATPPTQPEAVAQPIAQPPPVRIVRVAVPVDGPSPLPWVAISGGLAIAGVGGAFGYLATTRHGDATAAATGVDTQQLDADAHRYARVANILFAAGAAVAVAGTIWEVHDRRAHATRGASVTAVLTPGSIGLRARF